MALESLTWLTWLGIKSPSANQNSASGDVERLKANVGDWSAFVTIVENATTWSEFEQGLLDNGFTQEQADDLINRAQQAFEDEDDSGTDWDEYKAFVTNEATSYTEYKTSFPTTTGLRSESTTEDGQPAAGIRVHDEAGVSYSGVSLPAGTTEVFGSRIEFSQQSPAVEAEDLSYSNIGTDDADNVVNSRQTLEVSADVSNPNAFQTTVTIPLLQDGTVVQRQEVTVDASATVTVAFDVTKNSYICHEFAIGNSGSVIACWAPAGLTF